MRCKIYRKYLSAYIDYELSSNMESKITSHLAICNKCRMEYEGLLAIRDELNRLPQYEIPEKFNQRLMKIIMWEGRSIDKKTHRKIWAGIGTALLVVILVCIISTNIGIPKKYDMVANKQMESSEKGAGIAEDDYDNTMQEKMESSRDSDSVSQLEVGRKLIKSGSLELETLDFDRTMNGILTKINMMQGYVKSSSIRGQPKYNEKNKKTKRHATLEVRIPSKNFKKFMDAIDDIGHVTDKETYTEDITSQYFDTEARLKSLEIQEERLLTMLSKAEKLQDIIELEKELSRVRYDIETYTGTLKKWDNLIDYSRVRILVYEVEELKPQADGTFIEKISVGFINSIKNLAKFFENIFAIIIIGSPYIFIFGFLIWINKKLFINKKQNKDKRRENNEQESVN